MKAISHDPSEISFDSLLARRKNKLPNPKRLIMTTHITLPTSLNVRIHPRATADSTVLGVLPKGTLIDELDANEDRSWLRCRIGTLEGWVSNKYLLREAAYRANAWMPVAYNEFGVAETPGNRNHPRIDLYLATIGLAGKAEENNSWCSGFAKWCMLQARLADPSTPNPKNITSGARSWHTSKWGTDMTAGAPLGSVVVLWRRREANEDGGKDQARSVAQVISAGTGGHVGFLAEPFNAGVQKVTLLGGNQGNQVSKSTYDFGNNYGLLSIRSL
jgi:uncharacterized protein (TIGR02594 family)